MKVYIVQKIDYDQPCPDAVFSTKEKAVAFILKSKDKYGPYVVYKPHVLAYELDSDSEDQNDPPNSVWSFERDA